MVTELMRTIEAMGQATIIMERATDIKAQTADAMVAAEQARVEEAKRVAAAKISELQEQIATCIQALERIKEITGKSFRFYEVDLCDKAALEKVFVENPDIDSAIHFAGLKAVGESCQKPLEYYDNNINGTLVLVDVMRKHGCKNMIFSSSATVWAAAKVRGGSRPWRCGCWNGFCTRASTRWQQV